MTLFRTRLPMRSAPALAALALALGWMPAQAQGLRSSLDQSAQMMAQAGPQLGPTGVRQPVPFDPTNIAPGVSAVTPPGGTRSGAALSGATSRRPATRATKSVRRETGVETTRKPLRPPARDVVGLPPPPPEPIVRRRRPPTEADPWQSLGVDIGGVTIRPSIEVIGGYEDNPERRSTGPKKASSLARIEGDVDARSDWATHEFRARLRGGYSRYTSAPDASRPEAEGQANLRLDILRDTRADFETRYRLDSQRPGTAEANTQAVGRPLIQTYGGSAGIIQDINRLGLSLRGSVDRTDYQDGELSNGGRVDLSSRNVTQYGVRGRISYELTPGMRPFVDVLADTRRFDQTIDNSGFRRNSNGLGGRVGSTFEMSRYLTGEVALGYQTRKFDDTRLKELKGFIGETSLVWQATELTTVNLRGSLELSDTTLANVSGAQVRRIDAQIVHALRRNLNLTGYVTFAETEYDGIRLKEDILAVGARIDYRLTRTTSVRASFTHERFNSTVPGSDYTANVALLGLRFAL